MRQIKEMEADRIYLIAGSATANAAFFEREADCKTFLQLANRYLAAFVQINGFQNDQDGWAMIITTKSAAAIRTAYLERRTKSKKCKADCEHHEIWRMLSEQIRILLSTYVKITNMDRDRLGGKVRGNYTRFVFETAEEVLEIKKQFANHQYNQSQPQERYRPVRSLCEVTEEQRASSIYISCELLMAKKKLGGLGLSCLSLVMKLNDVLRQLVKTTLNHHFPPLTPNSS